MHKAKQWATDQASTSAARERVQTAARVVAAESIRKHVERAHERHAVDPVASNVVSTERLRNEPLSTRRLFSSASTVSARATLLSDAFWHGSRLRDGEGDRSREGH